MDLTAGGNLVTGVTRLKKNRKGEPSKAIKIIFESCTLPAEVWIECTPYGLGVVVIRRPRQGRGGDARFDQLGPWHRSLMAVSYTHLTLPTNAEV